jgi:hypothetical protein
MDNLSIIQPVSIIQPIVALLILSLTTEKIANVIKLWKFPTTAEMTETQREQRAQLISIVVGVVIAIVAKADLFAMFSKEGFTFFWDDSICGVQLIGVLVGCILTGGFLSLGSQFFHDLLAILFQVKSAKSMLNNLPKVENSDEVKKIIDEYLKETQPPTNN